MPKIMKGKAGISGSGIAPLEQRPWHVYSEIIFELEKRIQLVNGRIKNSNNHEQYSGKDLYKYGKQQLEWALKKFKGE